MISIKNALDSTIKGVFFDYGGVLEDLLPDETLLRKGVDIIRALLAADGVKVDGKKLFSMLQKGQDEYSRWSDENNHRELPNSKMWSAFFLKEICEDKARQKKVVTMSEQLSSIYEYYLYRRRPVRSMGRVVNTLFKAGYTLALVSNTMSCTLIPERLRKFAVYRYFSSVLLSVRFGRILKEVETQGLVPLC
jgi:FMN phosphatase YigB (HAD superfamily)